MDENSKLMLIGKRIRGIRKKRKLTQADLARIADMQAPNISELENGKTQMQLLTFIRIVEALQVSADEILRANVPSVNEIYQAECIELLRDCTPTEMESIMKIIRELKATMRSEAKNTNKK